MGLKDVGKRLGNIAFRLATAECKGCGRWEECRGQGLCSPHQAAKGEAEQGEVKTGENRGN
jgi:hypothetical protein